MAATASIPPASVGTSSYPDLDKIPASGPVIPPSSTAGSSSRVPRWARAIFSRFPLYEWPAAQIIDTTYEPPPSKPILYIAPGHPLPASLRAAAPLQKSASRDVGVLPGRGWASADPTCLRWQMELVFRGFDFDVRQIEPLDSWGPGPHNRLPYLRLPPSFQVSAPPPRPGGSSSRYLTSLVGADDLPRWVENHAPWKKDRVELREKQSPDTKGKGKMTEDPVIAAEIKTWISLLSTDLIAGVVSALLFTLSFISADKKAFCRCCNVRCYHTLPADQTNQKAISRPFCIRIYSHSKHSSSSNASTHCLPRRRSPRRAPCPLVLVL